MFEAAISKTLRFLCACYVTLHEFPFTSQLPTVAPHTALYTVLRKRQYGRKSTKVQPPPPLKKTFYSQN
jgi:hypothetical protein